MELSSFEYKRINSLDNTFFKMKGQKQSNVKLLQQQLKGLTNVVKKLLHEVQTNATLAAGTLKAFQIYIGDEEWNKIVEELKDIEKREVEQDKKLDLDVE